MMWFPGKEDTQKKACVMAARSLGQVAEILRENSRLDDHEIAQVVDVAWDSLNALESTNLGCGCQLTGESHERLKERLKALSPDASRDQIMENSRALIKAFLSEIKCPE